MTIKKDGSGPGYVISCDVDGCAQSQALGSHEGKVEAAKAAQAHGWKPEKVCGDWMDFCPDCVAMGVARP